ncbi:MAG: methyltransferase domain-containing protein [Actinobacteria bacterium]|nr:methyltransferase domain-containing protein [Actinomycetota bacterium]
MNSWNDLKNAEIYDAFARKHRMYRDTSRDLVELARMQPGNTAVDLACGTGVTTEVILERLDDTGRVIALDASKAMLQIAQSRVLDTRVQWMNADGSEVAVNVTDSDAIICNSAIWQTDMEPTLVACAKALRPGGRLVFNIGRNFLMMPLAPEELRPTKPTLFHLIQAVAVLDYGYAPPHPAMSRRPRKARGPLTPDSVQSMISHAGLVVDSTHENEYDNPAEAQFDWISVPVFADNVLPGMPYEQQREVIGKAYDRFDKETVKSRWLAFVAHKP